MSPKKSDNVVLSTSTSVSCVILDRGKWARSSLASAPASMEAQVVASKREVRAWYMYDWASSVYLNSVIAAFLPPLILAIDVHDEDVCVLHAQSFCMNAAAYYSFLVAFSVILQVLVFPILGAIGDYGSLRKRFLVVFMLIGSLSTVAMVFIGSGSYALAGILLIVSNCAFGASIVMYNAFLPLLVASHHTLKTGSTCAAPSDAGGLVVAGDDGADAAQPAVEMVDMGAAGQGDADVQDIVLEDDDASHHARHVHVSAASLAEHAKSLLMNEVSAHGMMWGYLGGLILLILNMAVLVWLTTSGPDEETDPDGHLDQQILAYRLALCMAGVWWFIFGCWSVSGLKSRPGPALEHGENYWTIGFKTIWRTARQMKHLKQMGIFLGAFFFYSDGYSTLGYGASLFATQELGFTSMDLAGALIASQLAALVGRRLYLLVNQRWLVRPKVIILVNIAFMSLIPIYGLIPGLFTAKWEFFVAAIVVGAQMGSIQSFSRSLMASFVPIGKESEFFGLMEVTTHGSAWMGPLLQGAIQQATGSIRMGLIAVLVMFVLGVPFLLFLNVDRAKDQADAFAESLAVPGTRLIDPRRRGTDDELEM